MGKIGLTADFSKVDYETAVDVAQDLQANARISPVRYLYSAFPEVVNKTVIVRIFQGSDGILLNS